MIEQTLTTLIESINELIKSIDNLPDTINKSSQNKEKNNNSDEINKPLEEEYSQKLDITSVKQKVIEKLTQDRVDRSAIKAVINSFGVESLDDLKEKDYSSFMESLQNLSETL